MNTHTCCRGLAWLLAGLQLFNLLMVATASTAAPKAQPTSVTPPPEHLAFPAFPSDAGISQAHVLAGPLLPISLSSIQGWRARLENRALSRALLAYYKQSDPENIGALTRFLREYPGTRYEAALLTNLGVLYKRQGRVSRRAYEISADFADLRSKCHPIPRYL